MRLRVRNKSLVAGARACGLDEADETREQIESAARELGEKPRLAAARRAELDRKIARSTN